MMPGAPTGGGWGKPILGGLFGAVAGNWLYDRFLRSDRPEYRDYGGGFVNRSYADEGPSYVSTPSAPSDEGQVGVTASGSGSGDDWGDSGGGGDSGGYDSGGDSGGSDSGGGGDW